MYLQPLPPTASWTHTGLRTGFEVLFSAGTALHGHTSAREGGSAWYVGYQVDVDSGWRTQSVHAVNRTAAGEHTVALARTPDAHWIVDGLHRPDLGGCEDVDFESSAVTNTLPIHRISFTAGTPVEVPAAFVQANDLSVVRIEQRYTLVSSEPGRYVFQYESTSFDFECRLTFDGAGLVLDYPGIAVRDR
ncbi:putative glycolipid-binding domain-containing protein [Kribbella solani]|uniref:putative glycolipid-binding domain-containing protein n=1 Tax=Kribbella solani TaxID=236067 RepID=UPI0029BE738F|nr:putative glycolipid-binding domain-containing protein [Kribbella solani]MDX3006342.1 putative glycolipid-binding domain-containing protein [Kribbella solani]